MYSVAHVVLLGVIIKIQMYYVAGARQVSVFVVKMLLVVYKCSAAKYVYKNISICCVPGQLWHQQQPSRYGTFSHLGKAEKVCTPLPLF